MIHVWTRPPFWNWFSFASFLFFFWLSLSTLPHRMTALWAALFYFFSNLVRSPNDPPTSPWWVRREKSDITATRNQRRAMLKPHRCRSETDGNVKSSCCAHQNSRSSSRDDIVLCDLFNNLCLIRKVQKQKWSSVSARSQRNTSSRPRWW